MSFLDGSFARADARALGQPALIAMGLLGLGQALVLTGEAEHGVALLRESREYLVVHEARLRALLRSLPEQVWMKDRAGRYLAVNAEFERFQGVSESGPIAPRSATVSRHNIFSCSSVLNSAAKLLTTPGSPVS